MNMLTYDELRLIEREERAGNNLYPLGEDFLDRFNAYVEDKERVLGKSDDNVIALKVKEKARAELVNARASFKNIFELRARKIFGQVFVDVRMGASPDLKGLLGFERDFYSKVKALVVEHFENCVKGKVKKREGFPFFSNDGNVLVRFVKDFPEFVWNGLTLGPFRKEDVVNLSSDVVKLLLSKEVVKEVL